MERWFSKTSGSSSTVRFRVERRGIIVERMGHMTITLPLEPQKEARLIALAQEKGVTPDELVTAAIDKILAEAPGAQALELPVWRLGAAGPNHRREIYDDAR